MHSLFLVLHVLAATIWTGGHIVLATTILPNVLKTNNSKKLIDFEQKFEIIGMPALVIQVATGLYLAYQFEPKFNLWFSFSDHLTNHIGIKLILLIGTLSLALNARFRLIPNINKNNNLKIFAVHIIIVTLISVLFVITGLSFRLDIF